MAVRNICDYTNARTTSNYQFPGGYWPDGVEWGPATAQGGLAARVAIDNVTFGASPFVGGQAARLTAFKNDFYGNSPGYRVLGRWFPTTSSPTNTPVNSDDPTIRLANNVPGTTDFWCMAVGVRSSSSMTGTSVWNETGHPPATAWTPPGTSSSFTIFQAMQHLNVSYTAGGATARLDFDINTGNWTSGSATYSWNAFSIVPAFNFLTWLPVIMENKWSWTADGYCKVHVYQSGAWTQVYNTQDAHGLIDTVQFVVVNGTKYLVPEYPEHGIYNSNEANRLAGNTEVFDAGLRICDTMAEAKAQFTTLWGGTGAVSPAVPSVATRPIITGSAVVNNVLSSDNGTWNNSPTGFTRVWRRNAVAVNPPQTGITYPVTTTDIGSRISVAVTASNAVGSATAISDETAPVPQPSSGGGTTQTFGFGAIDPLASGATWVGNLIDSKRASLYSLPQDGTPTKIKGYMKGLNAGVTCPIKFFIYGPVGADPTTAALKITTAELILSGGAAEGWVEAIPTTSVLLTAGDYLVGEINGGANNTIAVWVQAQANAQYLDFSDAYSDGPEATFGALSRFGNLLAYQVEYTPSTVPGPGDVVAPSLSTGHTARLNVATIHFNELLDTLSVPAASDFAFTLNGVAGGLVAQSVAISGSDAIVTFGPNLNSTDAPLVSYTPGTNKIRDLAHNNAASFSNLALINQTPPPNVVTSGGRVISGASFISPSSRIYNPAGRLISHTQ
jgi:hypothetical protein